MTIVTAKFILYPILVIFSIAVVLVLYWEYQDTDVLDIKAPITVEPPIAHSGEPIILTVSYCKNRSVTGTVRTSFVGKAIEIFQPMGVDAGPRGCFNKVRLPVLLPPATTVPPGQYKIKFNVVYKVNPFKTTTKTFYTNQFSIN